ncbi:MAG: electron transfer flavoprotein subunit beta/FixA family protein [Elusimicrobia bacterium]|nr:electron transfer flavoprotein subunit beta/FixA family protein [Elusimicrobiota bacterium]
MKIAVIFKQVPDTEAVIKPDPAKPGAIGEGDIKFVLNPYDEYAVEEALRIVEKSPGEAVGFCIGPERSEAAIRTVLAMGLQRAVWICEPAAVNADVISQGRILAAAIKGFAPDIILCGREVIDTQEDALAAAAAHFLDMPHVLNAAKITIAGDKATVVREVEGASLEIEAQLPAAISCSKGLNEPRYPTLIAIKRAKTKEIKRVTLAELGVQLGPVKSRVAALKSPPPRPKGVRVEGEPAVVAGKGVEWLAATAKVI